MRLKGKVAAALGSKSLAVVAGDISRLIDTVIAERGRVDILVNNAMKIVPGKLESLPEAAWSAPTAGRRSDIF